MRLTWHRSSSIEDRIENWVLKQHQERVLRGDTTPTGPCPDETFLVELACKSDRIRLDDPRVDHAATCAECMQRLLNLRAEHKVWHRKVLISIAIASCVVVALTIFTYVRYGSQRSPSGNEAIISQTIDLSDAGTIRGERPGALQSVILPVGIVKVTIILPRLSTPGKYAVAVTRDQTSREVQAEATAATTTSSSNEAITVTLDLRGTTTGKYYLSTTSEQDQISYYYPLEIR